MRLDAVFTDPCQHLLPALHSSPCAQDPTPSIEDATSGLRSYVLLAARDGRDVQDAGALV